MMANSTTQPPTPPPETSSLTASTFDIIHTYHSVLETDPLLTPPIAAIESLITFLSSSPPSTASETLSLLSTASKTLQAGAPPRASLSITAGTDLFQRYVINTLQARSSETWKDKDQGGSRESDFKAVRAHLLANSRLFVQRAKAARAGVAKRAKRFVRYGTTVCTCGGSRVVSAVLHAAADEGVSFQVVYVRADDLDSDRMGRSLVDGLRGKGVAVAVAPFAALATVLRISSFVMMGAENVVESGGVVSGLGAHQMGLLARSLGRPFYVVAESYKFVRFFPLGSEDLAEGGPEGALQFKVEEDGKDEERGNERRWGNRVDLTPPELVTALITEEGVHTPSAVSEELIKMWY